MGRVGKVSQAQDRGREEAFRSTPKHHGDKGPKQTLTYVCTSASESETNNSIYLYTEVQQNQAEPKHEHPQDKKEGSLKKKKHQRQRETLHTLGERGRGRGIARTHVYIHMDVVAFKSGDTNYPFLLKFLRSTNAFGHRHLPSLIRLSYRIFVIHHAAASARSPDSHFWVPPLHLLYRDGMPLPSYWVSSLYCRLLFCSYSTPRCLGSGVFTTPSLSLLLLPIFRSLTG